MAGTRLSSGGQIDRSKTIRFMFDDKYYSGHPGDTLASALLAEGICLFGRSFKYHRPRGLLSAGVDEPNGLVTVLAGDCREPNTPATMLEIHEGLKVESQNRFPTLEFDVMAINQLGGGLLGAGFYYKTFMGPVLGPLKGTKLWMFCEKFIRRAAGLGKGGYVHPDGYYENMNAFCDLLIVGAGPAGLAASLHAAKSGQRIIIADLNARLGGSLNWSGDKIEGQPAEQWVASAIEELSSFSNVRILSRTTVWGAYDSGVHTAVERIVPGNANQPLERNWVIRARRTIYATGALERPIVFSGNDRPGVMLADSVARYARQYGVKPGAHICLFTNNDSAYVVARDLIEAGVAVKALIDVRKEPGKAARQLLADKPVDVLAGHAVRKTSGTKALQSIEVQPFNADAGTFSGEVKSIDADLLGVSGGWSPLIHLASQAGAKAVWDDSLQAFLPPADAENWVGAGAFSGQFGLVQALHSGVLAAGGSQSAFDVESADISNNPAPVFSIRAKGKAFVDLQHDVTSDDVTLAHREGFHSVEHLKRYTTLGMATDQGKSANLPGLALMAQARDISIPEAGTTRFRPPFAPVSIGALAGEKHNHLAAHRYTPMHEWHLEHGAQMYSAGLWQRPMIYSQAGETVEQAYVREARAVRNGVGISDVSTLGKILVQGPDAAAFLNRVYTNGFAKLPVGKARYGLMLREDGFVLDDGTTWRLGEHEFLMTTTTANAGKVMQHLEYFLDCIWPDLRVHLTSVTDQWAGAAIAGPKSRQVLEACISGVALDGETLPFMGVLQGKIEDVPVLICRLSFSGELAFEVYCGSHYGTHVWEALMEAGKPHNITPYGLEALGTLRIEKGHVTGAEIDGRTTARDMHLDWMLSSKKPFIGSRMMDRPGMIGPHRQTLVGIKSLNGKKFSGGAHIVETAEATEPAVSLGHVTAMCYSPVFDAYLGLAFVINGIERIGQTAYATDPVRGSHVPIKIVSHHFYDPEGSRMHG